jgi:hypothetical protein
MTSFPAPAKRRSRFWLYAPFTLLLGFSAVWTGFWFYGRGKVVEEMDKALARVAASGQTLTCPDRKIGGFPFRMEVTCTNAAFGGPSQQGPISGTIGTVIVTARALDPTAVIGVLQGPLLIDMPQGTTKAEWSEARISIRASGMSLGSADLVIKGLSVDGAAPNMPGGRVAIKIKDLESHIRQKPSSVSGNQADYDLVTKIVGLTSASIPALADSTGIDLEMQATATRFPLQPSGKADALLDAWRDAGGLVTVVLAKLGEGNASAEAKGELKLDANRMLAGKLDLALVNLDKVADKLALEVPGFVKPMLKNGKVPLTLGNGRAGIGPIPLAELKPLY